MMALYYYVPLSAWQDAAASHARRHLVRRQAASLVVAFAGGGRVECSAFGHLDSPY